MILIEEILVSEELIENKFVCNLTQCKGACCVEGDYGAPLEKDEIDTIKKLFEKIKPYLSTESIDKINKSGFFTIREEEDIIETQLMEDGACVFMGRNELGITFCGIEKAYLEGKTDFKKPISCHLYPVRVYKNKHTGFEALNYDRWDICNSACTFGESKNIRVFEFVKDALVRKYGIEFYEELSAAADHLSDT